MAYTKDDWKSDKPNSTTGQYDRDSNSVDNVAFAIRAGLADIADAIRRRPVVRPQYGDVWSFEDGTDEPTVR